MAAPSLRTFDGTRQQMVWSRLAAATALTAILAVGCTSLIYAAALAAGLVDREVELPSLIGMGPFSLASVAVTALAASVGAGILFGVLGVTTRRPVRNFRIVATVLGLLSISMPATIPGPPLTMRLTMATMHFVVWALSFGVLASAATRRIVERSR